MKWRIYHYGGSHVKLAFSALLMRNLKAEHTAANVADLPSQASSTLPRLLDAFANTVCTAYLWTAMTSAHIRFRRMQMNMDSISLLVWCG